MSLGNAWENITPASTSKMNTSTVVYGSGTYLESLDKTKHKIFVCTSSGGALLVNHIYLCSADGLSLIDVSQVEAHTHSSGAGQGGLITNIDIAVPEHIDLLLTKTTDVVKASWIQTVTGTGTIEDNTDGSSIRNVRLRPNATSASGATISYPSTLNLSFAERSIFVAVGQIETATNIAIHTGVGADDVTAADSNTRKYQHEICTVTNNNHWLRTADGTANSASDSGAVISTSKFSIRIIHLPDLGTPEVNMEIDAANFLQKTSNIPTSSASPTANLIKFSVKNSTAADRPYKAYGARLSFMTSSSWGYG